MTSRKRFMAVWLGWAAWCGCTAGAFAQARPATPPPHDTGRPAIAQLPNDFP